MSSPPSCPIVLRSKEHSRQNSQKLGGQISLFYLFLSKFKCSQKTPGKDTRGPQQTLSNNIDPMCTFNRNKHFPPTFVLCIAECCKEAGKIALLWRSKLESKIRVSGQLLCWLCSTNMNFLGNNKSKMLYFDLSIFTFYQLEHKNHIFHMSQASGEKAG